MAQATPPAAVCSGDSPEHRASRPLRPGRRVACPTAAALASDTRSTVNLRELHPAFLTPPAVAPLPAVFSWAEGVADVGGGGFAAAIGATRALGLRFAAGFCFHARHQGTGLPEPSGLALAAVSRRGFRQPPVRVPEHIAHRAGAAQPHGDPPHADGDLRGDLQPSQPDGAHGGLRQSRAAQGHGAHSTPELIGEGGEPQAQLIARQERGGGAVREHVIVLITKG